jgi:hypothetical protein
MMPCWTWSGIILLLYSTGLVTTAATAPSVVDDAGQPQASSQTLPPISRCVSTMLLFDANEDRWLNRDEFVDVIDRLLDGCDDSGGRGNINDNDIDGEDAIDALYDEVRYFCLDYVDVDACCDWGVDLSGTYPAAYLNQVCHRIHAHVMEHDGGVNGGVDCDVEDGAPIGTAATPANTTTSNEEETSVGVLGITPDSITTTANMTNGGKPQRRNNRRTVWIALVVGAFAAISFIVVFGMVSRRQLGKKTSAAAGVGDDKDTTHPRQTTTTTTTAAPRPCDNKLLNRPPSPLVLLQESSGVPLGILRRTPDVPAPIGTSTYIPGAALSIMVSGLLHSNSEVQIVADHHHLVDIDRPGTIHEVSFEESTSSSMELA